jgi:hypothetical protein
LGSGRISLEIIVRNENKKDYRRVEAITRKAFAYPDRIERGGIGCPYEHWMVHELRRRDGILELSLVATVNDGLLDSMKRVMLGDRLFGRAKQMEFIVFDNTSRENELREKNWDANLQKAYEIGKGLFA